MPLILYLDSQDYLNIFYESGKGVNSEIIRKILDYKNRGIVSIGFSFANIFEVITKPNIENRSERVRRGRVIKEICGPHAFPYITDLTKGATFPNEGMWMLSPQEKIISAQKFRSDLRKYFLKAISETPNLNRATRRKLSRSSSFSELMQTSNFTWGRKRSDYGNIPVSNEFIENRVFERFVKGLCSDTELEQRLNAWFCDPEEYSRIVYDYADHPNVIDKYFGENVDKIEKLAGEIQDYVVSLKDINNKSLEIRSKLIEAGMQKGKARNLTRHLSLPEFKEKTRIDKLDQLVGSARSGHFSYYLNLIMKPGYSFNRSDVMDLMQMCYAYDCDLFRCDKAMATYFKGYEPFNGKLVGHFSELPDRIEKLIC